MTEPRIVDAEVIEIPKPERPELWIQIAREPTLADPGAYAAYFACVEKPRTVPCDHFLVRIPGTTAPAPATATDAEIDIILNRLSAANGCVVDGEKAGACRLILEAMERLAKIRGGR